MRRVDRPCEWTDERLCHQWQASSWLYLVYFAQRQATSGGGSRAPILKSLLHTFFSALSTRRHVLLVLPQTFEMENEPILGKFFERVKLRRDAQEASDSGRQFSAKVMEAADQYVAYSCAASDFLPPVHVR